MTEGRGRSSESTVRLQACELFCFIAGCGVCKRNLKDVGRRRRWSQTGRDVVVARSQSVGLAELGARGQRPAVQLQQQLQLGALRAPATWPLGVVDVSLTARLVLIDLRTYTSYLQVPRVNPQCK